MLGSSTHAEGWFYHVTADAQIVGIVTWIGLLITIAGFWIAIAQIRKIKRSSQAASDAVAGLVKVVRSREQGAKIADALAHLTSARSMMNQKSSDAAIAYLSIGWSALVSANELSDDATAREEIVGYLVSTRRLLDDISAPGAKAPGVRALSDRHYEISELLSGLGLLSARLNATLPGTGTRP